VAQFRVSSLILQDNPGVNTVEFVPGASWSRSRNDGLVTRFKADFTVWLEGTAVTAIRIAEVSVTSFATIPGVVNAGGGIMRMKKLCSKTILLSRK